VLLSVNWVVIIQMLFLHRSILKVEKNAYIFGGVPHAGLGASNSITSSLTWSTTRSYNIGADLDSVEWIIGSGIRFIL
ncbi:hypothetical protein NXV13_30280, partial [Bacteroides ovatus]|nr:hypothetical protein [Bacteroides ovatus]